MNLSENIFKFVQKILERTILEKNNKLVKKMHPNKLNHSTVHISRNGTHMYDDNENEYLYDRTDVRAVCIILYSIVFIACFFGNLIVIVVVTVHWRMRSITNFCLANLAFADFCVSIFCVYQNMYIYFMSSWVFGAFLCKMYYFITELSHTASILILIVICIERYLAIIHPMRCKEWLTLTRLRLTIIGVWGTSAIYSSPRLYFTNTGTITLNNGDKEILCIPIRTLYDSEIFDMISLAVLFILPLLVITILYTHIGLALWESSKNNIQHIYLSPPSVSATPVAIESCSSSEHDLVEGINIKLFKKHSCTDILCCGCDPCRIRFPHVRKSYISSNNKTIIKKTKYVHNNERTSINNSSKKILSSTSHHGSSLKLNNDDDNEENDTTTIHLNSIDSKEPIVLVKFQNKKNLSLQQQQKQRKNNENNHCTVLFNVSNPSRGVGVDHHRQRQEKQQLNSILSTTSSSNVHNIKSTNTNEVNHSIRTTTTIKSPKLKRMTVTRGSKYGSRALESRRRIIKMLIIIVFTFAICNLPFHARKLWQSYGSSYFGGSTFSSIFTPATFLIMYANSGINPILYAFMSKKFRLCFMDILNCKLRRSLRVARNASVRSTHIIPLNTPAGGVNVNYS